MITTRVESLNATVQKTQEWLEELAPFGGFAGEAQAYTALRAVLQTLRDRLTVDEAAHLSAQLPMLVRGFYFEGWKPAETPRKLRTKEEFLADVERNLGPNSAIDAEIACRAVFDFLDAKIDKGELNDVRRMLTAEVRAMWPGA